MTDHKKLLSIEDFLKQTFCYGWNTFGKFYSHFLPVLVVLLIGGIIGGILLFAKLIPIAIAVFVITFLVMVYQSLVAQAAIMTLFFHGTDHHAVNWSSRFAFGKKNIWKLLGISIVKWLVVVGGFILLVVPGIVLNMVLVFAIAARIVEGKSFWGSFARSNGLTYGYKWGIFGRMILYWLVLYIAQLAITIISSESQVVGTIILIVFLVYSAPTSYAAIGALYNDLSRDNPDASRPVSKKLIYACIAVFVVLYGAIFALIVSTPRSLPTMDSELPELMDGAQVDMSSVEISDAATAGIADNAVTTEIPTQ